MTVESFILDEKIGNMLTAEDQVSLSESLEDLQGCSFTQILVLGKTILQRISWTGATELQTQRTLPYNRS